MSLTRTKWVVCETIAPILKRPITTSCSLERMRPYQENGCCSQYMKAKTSRSHATYPSIDCRTGRPVAESWGGVPSSRFRCTGS